MTMAAQNTAKQQQENTPALKSSAPSFIGSAGRFDVMRRL